MSRPGVTADRSDTAGRKGVLAALRSTRSSATSTATSGALAAHTSAPHTGSSGEGEGSSVFGTSGLGLRGTGPGGGGSAVGIGGLGSGTGRGTGGHGDIDLGGRATLSTRGAHRVATAYRVSGLAGRGEDRARKPVPQNLPPLRAGATDDNEDFAGFVKFVTAWSDLPSTATQHCRLDVREQRRIRVRDLDENPVPNARVEISDPVSGQTLFTGTTYGDGSLPFYPRVFASQAQRASSLRVHVHAGDARGEAALEPGSTDPVQVYLDRRQPPRQAVALDVVFLLDTTSSMSDEIRRIKQTLLKVTRQLRQEARDVDLRYGAVLYRDRLDDYITSHLPLTAQLEQFDEELRQVISDGGGDMPESLNQALAETVHEMQWRDDAARVVFLVADAPPHMDYDDDTPYGDSLKEAVAHGLRIHSVAASGLDDFGSLVFRQIAQFTRGQFIFIQYGSLADSAAAHGVGGQFSGNNLDAIILGRLRWEIENFGTER